MTRDLHIKATKLIERLLAKRVAEDVRLIRVRGTVNVIDNGELLEFDFEATIDSDDGYLVRDSLYIENITPEPPRHLEDDVIRLATAKALKFARDRV